MSNKRTRLLPWDADHSEGNPWHLHRWWIHADSGTICLVDAKIKYNTVTRKWEREEQYENRFKGNPHLMEKAELERIFTISATEDIDLMAAAVEFFGEDEFSNSELARMGTAPKVYADARYAKKKPEPKAESTPAQKRGPGRPKKVSTTEA